MTWWPLPKTTESTLFSYIFEFFQFYKLVYNKRIAIFHFSGAYLLLKIDTLYENWSRKESLLTLHNPCSIVHCLIMSAIIPIHINTPMKIKRLRTIYSIDKDSGFTSDFKHAHSFSHHVWRLYYFDYNASIYLMMSYRHTYTVEVTSIKSFY